MYPKPAPVSGQWDYHLSTWLPSLDMWLHFSQLQVLPFNIPGAYPFHPAPARGRPGASIRREVPEDCGTASGHSPPLPHSPHLPAPRHAPAAGYVCPLGPQDEQHQNCGWMPCPGENEDPAGQLWSGPGSREQSLQE